MNIRRTNTSFPPQLTMLAAAMLAGLGVVASVDAGSLPQFEMLAFVDAPGGVEIVRQDFASAIERAGTTAGKQTESSLMRQTNLCVAHTMSAEWPQATPACNTAVTIAESLDDARFSKRTRAMHLARAYANRGVSLWMSGDRVSAEADFAAAELHAPRANFVQRNLGAVAARQIAVATNRP